MKQFLTISLFLLISHLHAQQMPYALIPAPQKINLSGGIFTFNAETKIFCSPSCINETLFFVEWMNAHSQKKNYSLLPGTPQAGAENFILFSSGNEGNSDSQNRAELQLPKSLDALTISNNAAHYKISMDQRAIIIDATEPLGVFYAIQTIAQFFPASNSEHVFKLPQELVCVKIEDEPSFEHRGLLLDCCRHFMSVDFIKKYIDVLAMYKMNVLHWHLTEDQGWRIQIDKYPLLTEIGSWRKEKDGSTYGGFYTKDQIKEIVTYAHKRHVEIIPEIELPGHSSAALAAYPHLGCSGEQIEVENEWGVFKDIFCAGNDTTLAFLKDVLDEVCELFPGKYIHIGGDEAPKIRWEECPKCQGRIANEHLKNEHELQSWMIQEIAEYLHTKGKQIIGWDEILEGGIPSDAVVQSWQGIEGGLAAANQQHKVVMSPTSHCYFDYNLESIDLAKVYSFDPIPAELAKDNYKYILGGECNMWTEHAPQDLVDSKVFPRMLALAEVLWTYPKARDLNAFSKRLDQHFLRLARNDIQYGLPSIPLSIADSLGKGKNIIVTVHPMLDDLITEWKFKESAQSNVSSNFQKLQGPITVPYGSAKELIFKVTYQNIALPDLITRKYVAHKALGSALTLSYTPSKYYPGSGNNCLSDGRIGSGDFRDKAWQAVAGSNMEIEMDFGSELEFSEVETHFYHYTNAWIFRPNEVKFEYSSDGQNWIELGVVQSAIEVRDTLQGPVTFEIQFQKKKARYVRMSAQSIGACPPWHDAPGEPSWLFCDEIIVN